MNSQLVRYYWALWAAFVLQAAGNVWDGRWHAAHGRFENGSLNVLQAHWLLMLAALLAAVVPALVMRHWRDIRRSLAVALGFGCALVFGVAQCAGLLWDTLVHLHVLPAGQEAAAHWVRTIGFYGSILAMVCLAAAYIMGLNDDSKSGAMKT